MRVKVKFEFTVSFWWIKNNVTRSAAGDEVTQYEINAGSTILREIRRKILKILEGRSYCGKRLYDIYIYKKNENKC